MNIIFSILRAFSSFSAVTVIGSTGSTFSYIVVSAVVPKSIFSTTGKGINNEVVIYI